ncbi:hypothetical protein TNCV_1876591 [Trichonephila clavipes]|nr:hypothetical protein TNCV_1876591 [Trichonephila clavipes]
MQAQYGDSCLTPSEIYEGIERFKQGRTSLCEDERSGSPSTSTTEDNVQVVEGIVLEDMTSIQGSYTRAYGDGPRNFEPWSDDVDDT